MFFRHLQALLHRNDRRRLSRLALIAVLAVSAHAQTSTRGGPGVGVSRELARSRASRLSDLRYALTFALEPGSRQTHGTETVTFQLSDASADLPLDYRDGTLEEAQLNGHVLSTELHDGHLLLPTDALQSGKNTVILHFTSRVDTAGAAITRYIDKEDGSEYLYSLFVPMD